MADMLFIITNYNANIILYMWRRISKKYLTKIFFLQKLRCQDYLL